jgi:uridylate kinase
MELKCDAIIKATKVDGIYDKDPAKYHDAVKFDNISYDETLARRLGVMDATAFALVRDNNLPIIVYCVIVWRIIWESHACEYHRIGYINA